MNKEDKGKRLDFSVGLHPRDFRRLTDLQAKLEATTGRPSSRAKALMYLLDLHDEMVKIDETIAAETRKRK